MAGALGNEKAKQIALDCIFRLGVEERLCEGLFETRWRNLVVKDPPHLTPFLGKILSFANSLLYNAILFEIVKWFKML